MKKTLLLLAMAVGFNLANAQTTVFDDFKTSGTDYWNFYGSNYINDNVTNPSAVGNTSVEVGKYTRFVPVNANEEYQGLGCKLKPGYTPFAFFSSYNTVEIDVYAAQAFSLALVLQDNGASNIDVLTVTKNYAIGDINTWKTLTFDFSSVSGNVITPGNGYALLWKFDDGLMNSTALDYYVDNFVGKTITTGVFNEVSNTVSKLDQNTPNPFSSVTSINYSLKQAGDVSLSIYDVLGKPVASLMNNQSQTTGDYNYTFNAESLREGIYYYTLTVGEISETKRMVIQK